MRRESRDREIALRFVYLCDIRRGRGAAQDVYKTFVSDFGLGGSGEFCQILCVGTLKNLAKIDTIIETYAQNWTVARMAVVDRSLLRVGTYELVGLATPFKVVIDEMVELAKRYGGSGSRSFVNGMLHSIAHGVTKQKWN